LGWHPGGLEIHCRRDRSGGGLYKKAVQTRRFGVLTGADLINWLLRGNFFSASLFHHS
jgi:hypothetical protein